MNESESWYPSVITFNMWRDEHCRNCIQALLDQDTTQPFEIVRWQIGPTTVNTEDFQLPEHVSIIKIDLKKEEQLNLSKSRNIVVDQAKWDYLHFVDIDCVVEADYVETMNKALQEDPKRVYTASVSYYSKWNKQVDRTRDVIPWEQLSYDLVRTLTLSLHRDQFENIWGFDEWYVGYGGEDTDFGRAMRSLHIPYIWTSTRLYHQWHPSYSPPVLAVEPIVRNANYGYQKWGERFMQWWLEKFEELWLVTKEKETYNVVRALTKDEAQEFLVW